jgi:hypothetical protein
MFSRIEKPINRSTSQHVGSTERISQQGGNTTKQSGIPEINK